MSSETAGSSSARGYRRGRRRLWLAAVLVVAVTAMFVSQAGSLLVMRRPLSRPDVIVSLASHEWERLPVAAQQALAHVDALILLTEPEVVTPFNCHDCAHRTQHLHSLGVASERVRVVKITTSGTHGEAVASLEFARANRVQRLLIVTSPYHTRRALAVFQHVFRSSGIEVGIEPALSHSHARPAWWWWQPDDRAYVPYEWTALVYYWWRYGVRPPPFQY